MSETETRPLHEIRQEYLAQCKQRALSALNAGFCSSGISQMASDLSQPYAIDKDGNKQFLYQPDSIKVLLIVAYQYTDKDDVRKWIKGFH